MQTSQTKIIQSCGFHVAFQTKNNFKHMKLVVLLLLALQLQLVGQAPNKNVLFIAVDDLKPLIGAYGHKQMVTPNLDRLINSGVMFENAEVQQAVCGPSRASVMTGTYPDRTRVWDLHTDFRSSSPSLVSMPEYLITQGYETAAVGKIYHKGSTSSGHDGKSWSIPHFQMSGNDPERGAPILEYYQNLETKATIQKYIDEAKEKGMKPGQQRNYAMKLLKPSTEAEDVADESYQDGAYTVKALELMNSLSKGSKPFFLAVGFQKPHLPFVAPKKYWNLYDRKAIQLSNQALIEGTPDYAYQHPGELNAFTDIRPKAEIGKPLPDDKQRELMHGYMACVSYIDAQIGKLLDELEKLNLTKNTVIVLWGDHGWHLGDHTLWCKHSNFEQATRIPFVFAGPNISRNKKVETPVELIDLFPTLFDLIGVPQHAQTDGKSLITLLDNDKKNNLEIACAMSQYPRQNGKLMGYTIRTTKYRYTEWHANNYTTEQPYNIANIKDVELYDFANDPNETTNHANDPKLKKVQDELHILLQNKLNTLHSRTKNTPKGVASKHKNKNNEDDENDDATTNPSRKNKNGGKNAKHSKIK